MESLILSEIPHLNSVYSDEKYLYVPEFDQRITLSAVLTTLFEDNIDIYANKIILSGQQQFSIITLPSLEKVFANTEPIVKETLIDGGRKYQLNDKHHHICDYIFNFGETYVRRLLWYRNQYELSIVIGDQTIADSVPIDVNGYPIKNNCKLNDKCFLHPSSMIEEDPIVQFFIPLFNKRYATSFKFVGSVYDDDYDSKVFIDTTDATYGQVFLLGVSWALNRKQIEAGISDIWKTNPKSLYQYPVWHAYHEDFPKKWPWSKEYDGSAPELAIKYARHLPEL